MSPSAVSADVESTEDYWTTYTRGLEPCFLPKGDGTCLEADEDAWHSSPISLPDAGDIDLEATSRDLGVTVAVLLRAAWTIVLRLYCGQEDISFQLYDAEGKIGLVRLSVSQNTQLSELLETLAKDAMISQAYYGSPKARNHNATFVDQLQGFCNSAVIQTANTPTETVSATPNHNGSATHTSQDGVFHSRIPLGLTGKTALTGTTIYLHHVLGKGVYVRGRKHYTSPEEIGSLAKCTSMALRELAKSHGTTSLESLKILHDTEYKQILEWNAVRHDYLDMCVHDMVYLQVCKTPDACAIDAWDGSMTYAQLWDSSSALASQLRLLNVGPETIVPSCFPKSLWHTVSSLAILIAGGACVSLDPSHPIDRLCTLVETVNAKVVLTASQSASLFQSLAVPNILIVDDALIKRARLSTEPVADSVPASHKNIAFVVFTSGTTGKPKAILQEHGAFCSSAAEYAALTGLKPGRRILQFAAHIFDVSISDLFATLAYGACICIPSDDDRSSDLAGFMTRFNVNQASITPTVAQLLQPQDVPCLEVMTLSGEPTTPGNISTWSEALNLIELYGPAEACVLSSAQSSLKPTSRPECLGYAVGGWSWITNPDNPHQLSPIGAIGEILLEGPLLARGYLNDFEKTSASFVSNLAWTGPNTDRRFYRTGDLARYGPDGTMRFFGRRDTQIKLHGQRIEPSEIERYIIQTGLTRHIGVSMPTTGPCKNSLVGFFSLVGVESSKENSANLNLQLLGSEHFSVVTDTVRELQDHLRRLVPSYMIPTNWFAFKELPVTASGKLDRRSVVSWISKMTTSELFDSRQMMRPYQKEPVRSQDTQTSTDIEISGPLMSLQQLVSMVLNIPRDIVKTDHTFIELGGDSVSAMLVATRCRADGQYTLRAQDVLSGFSLSHVASHMVPVDNKGPDIKDIPDGRPFSLAPVQRLHCESTSLAHGNLTQSMMLEVKQPITRVAFEHAITQLVQYHDMLRARFEYTEEHYWRQEITNFLPEKVAVSSFDRREEDFVRSHVDITRKSLDPKNGPAFAASLFGTGQDEPIIFLTAHHLVVDIVSWHILLGDLETLLETSRSSMLNGNGLKEPATSVREQPAMNTRLGRKGLSFASWCELQSEYLATLPLKHDSKSDAHREADLNFWGVDAAMNTHGSTTEVSFDLDTALTSALLGVCNKPLSTEVSDILLGTAIYTFAKVFEERAVTPPFFEEHNGRVPWRRDIDVSSTVGWFAVMRPIQLSDRSPSCIDAIKQVKESRRSTEDSGWHWFSQQFAPKSKRQIKLPVEVIFNYFGVYRQLERENGLFKPVGWAAIQPSEEGAAETPRTSVLELSLVVADSQLRTSLSFTEHTHKVRQIRDWMKLFQEELNSVIGTLTTLERQLTKSEFPLLRPSDHQLQNLTETLRSRDIPASRVMTAYPCTDMQRGILISQVQKPELYQISCCFFLQSIDGQPLSLDVLNTAWREIIDRHDILQTVVVEDMLGNGDFGLVQIHDADAHLLMLGPDNDAVAFQALDDLPPMDLSATMLHRRLCVAPLTSDGSRFACRLDISHAIFDGVSLPILLKQLVLACAEHLPRQPALSYREYVGHLQATAPERGEMIKFWSKFLDGCDPCFLRLCRQPLPEGANPALVTLEVPVVDGHKLLTFCKSHSLTPTAVIHVAWALVLRCYCATQDPCFGYLSAHRDLPLTGVEDAIGAYLNMLVCRVPLDGDSSVLEVMRTVHADTMKSVEHQHVSLAEIHQAVGVGSTGLFNTVVSQESPLDAGVVSSGNYRISDLKLHDPSEYAIGVHVFVLKETVKISIDYWTSALTPEEAQNVSHTFATILQNIVEHPNDAVADLHWCSPHDMQRINDWNAVTPVPIERCLHGMIDDVVARTPHAEAIYAWDGRATYAELDAYATVFMNALLATSSDVGPGIIVPVCFGKTMWFAVAVLAVLKAGASFVALDANHPLERLKSVTEDVGASVVLASPDHAPLCVSLGLKVVEVSRASYDSSTKMIAELSNRPRKATPSDPAYLIFTSGSTGKPKGSVIEHRAICSIIPDQAKGLHMDSNSRVLQFASYAFDAYVLEIITTLVVGGCVCVPADADRLNDLGRAARELRVTWAHLTPSMLKLLSPSDIPSLEVMTYGGEALTQAVVDRWSSAVKFAGSYGPSECSVSAVMNSDIGRGTEPSDIGVGVNTLPWIVDVNNIDRLAPVGSVGELLLEGPSLAREYLNNRTKTAEAFIKAPLWASGPLNRRFYRTGDIVKYGPRGNILFVGRKDSQIKIHGQRVELGEVEHQLAVNSAIRHAVVLFPTQGPLKHTLTAIATLSNLPAPTVSSEGALQFIVDGADAQVAATTLSAVREEVATALPPYMVPAVVVALRIMPFQLSGKLDRKAIAQGVDGLDRDMRDRIMQTYSGNQEKESDHVWDPLEARLRSIWSRLLNVEEAQVHPKSSFIRHGGDSISALQFVSECRASGISVTVQTVLQSKSLAEIAAGSRFAEAGVRKTVADTSKAAGSFALSPIQRLYFEHAPQGESLSMQSMFLKCKPKVARDDVKAALEHIMASHPMLRARYSKPNGSRWEQSVLPVEETSLPFESWTTPSLSEITPAALQLRQSLDIQKGPVFAGAFARVGDESYLFLVAHHLVIDLMSWRIILNDLQQSLNGQQLTFESTTFQEWSDKQAAYAIHNLPPDRVAAKGTIVPPAASWEDSWGIQSGSNTWSTTVRQSLTLPEADSVRLLDQSSQRLRAEPVDVFHACLIQAFFGSFSRCPSIFDEAHGRQPWTSDMDIASTVGWFTTLSPVPITLMEPEALGSILRKVKTARRAMHSKGWAYFTSRYLNGEGMQKFGGQEPEVLVNFFGRFQQLEQREALFRPVPNAAELVGPDDDPSAERHALIDVEISVDNDILKVDFIWNKHMRHQELLHDWVAAVEASLKQCANLMDSDADPDAVYTLSDFPLLDNSLRTEDELQALLQRIGMGTGRGVSIQDVYPCCAMQAELARAVSLDRGYYEGTWFWAVSAKQTAIDIERLRRSWIATVQRHDSLRTVMREHNGAWMQAVLSHPRIRIKLVETSQRERGPMLDRLQAAAPGLSYVDPTEPPHHLTIMSNSDGLVMVRLDISHAVTDGAAVEVALRDWAAAYAADGQLSSLPPVQYRDYISYLHRYERAAGRDYWAQYLAGAPACNLPVSNQIDQEAPFRATHRMQPICSPAKQTLFDLCAAHNVTVASLIKLAWATLLARRTHSKDVVFGYLVSGRQIAVDGAQEIVGPLFNTLAARLRFDDGAVCYLDRLVSVHQDFVGGLAYQDISIAEVCGSNVPGGYERPFNTLVNYRRSIGGSQGDEKAAISQEPVLEFQELACWDPMEYAVVVEAFEKDDQLEMHLSHWTGEMDAETAEGLAKEYEGIIAEILNEAQKGKEV